MGFELFLYTKLQSFLSGEKKDKQGGGNLSFLAARFN